jgi:hypothetical protein
MISVENHAAYINNDDLRLNSLTLRWGVGDHRRENSLMSLVVKPVRSQRGVHRQVFRRHSVGGRGNRDIREIPLDERPAVEMNSFMCRYQEPRGKPKDPLLGGRGQAGTVGRTPKERKREGDLEGICIRWTGPRMAVDYIIAPLPP